MQDLTPDEFAKNMRIHPKAIILDVRTPEEFESGHLPGALNIDIRNYDFAEQLENLDHSNAYFVYCHSGGRSNSACRFMDANGFVETYNLRGGMMAWEGETE